MDPSEEFIRERLEERKANGTYRTLKPESGLVDFCSNDYLGFARSNVLKELIRKELEAYPQAMNGSTGSRLLSGNSAYAEELEKQIAAFHEAEAGLIYNSGYDANIGLFSSLPQKGDTIIKDELAHASIIDGARLSFANRYNFRHNDVHDLEDKLKQAKGNCFIAIESVYSMDGDIAPVAEMAELARKYQAKLIVDEAHATGLYYNGLVNQFGHEEKVFARIVTFGKALGCHGAIVLGSTLLREYLVNFSRSFIYTTAAPFHQLASVKCAYKLLMTSGDEIQRLEHNISLFKEMVSLKHNLLPSDSAIQCIIIGGNERTTQLAAQLQEAGFDIRPILSPTVAAGSERLRICLHSHNTAEEISALAETLNRLTND